MIQNAGNLQDLRDIVEPSSVSSWPWAPGWWVVFSVAVVGLGLLACRMLMSWRANAYRREALQQLQSATTASAVSLILKRTALSVWPRAEVASLTGTAWCDWLQKTASAELPVSVRELLIDGLYRAEHTNIQALSKFAATWIRTHDSSVMEQQP